jgi:hypothetical protein
METAAILRKTGARLQLLGDFETASLSGLKAPSWLATPSASHLLRVASPLSRRLRSIGTAYNALPNRLHQKKAP